MNKPWAQRWRGCLVAAGVGVAANAQAQHSADPVAGTDTGPGHEPDALTEEEHRLLKEALAATAAPSFWSTTGSARAYSGYRDNVLLSPFNPVGAPFLGVGADAILSRLPTDGTEVTLLGTGEYTVFLDAPEAEPEALALAEAGVKRALGNHWEAGLTGEYVFLHQVFDVSATEAELSTVTARGNTFTLTPTGSLELGHRWGLTLEADGTRQFFTAPLDSYWEVKPSLALRKSCAGGTELALSYTFGGRWYDTRTPLDAQGNELSGRLEFNAHEIELRSTIYWDAPRRFRTQLRFGWLENEDNGGGYFEFTRLSAAAQVQYQAGRWTFRLDGRIRWYDYPVQPSDGPDSTLRERTDLSGLLRGEFMVSRRVRVFAQYERDVSDDNAPDTSYYANGLMVGAEFEF